MAILALLFLLAFTITIVAFMQTISDLIACQLQVATGVLLLKIQNNVSLSVEFYTNKSFGLFFIQLLILILILVTQIIVLMQIKQFPVM